MTGHRQESKRIKRKKQLSHGWIVVPSKTYPERVYFYNVFSKCSSWINPCDVLNGKGSNKNADTSMESKYRRPSSTPITKKRKATEAFTSFTKENTDIEDYDEENDLYFDANFNLSESNILTPRSSPDSAFSSKTNQSDSDTSKSNMVLEDDKKELWLQFASSKNSSQKKSLALSDFELPSTSGQSTVEEKLHNDINVPKIDQNSNKRNRKKKKKRSKEEEEKDRLSFETTRKNISFKVKDKTPAQTGILKLRREYAEKIKKMVDSSTPFRSKAEKNKNCNVSGSSSATDSLDCLGYHDKSRAGTEFKNSFQQKEVLHDSSEEMDWEPSSEESDVRNINEFRQQYDRAQTSSNVFYELNGSHKTSLPSQTQELVLVLDTNIFVSCLNFVKDLRDTKVGDLGYPIIYVPWRVLQELDHLKDSKIDGTNKQLSVNVRKAITFLNENFKFKHPRVFGQSFEDFNKMMDLDNFAPDDEILQTCLQLKKRHLNIKLMLLTNDKNLESKANVSGVKVYSKEGFHKKYLTLDSFRSSCSNSTNVTLPLQGQILQPSVQIDNYICEIKALLKEFLSAVVETEMRSAFEGDWLRIVYRKPPWTSKEALDCFLKHWRAVFFLVFSKQTLHEAENLNEKLFNKEPANTQDVSEIISTFQRFIKCIISSQKKKRPYLDLTEGLLNKLSCFLKDIQINTAAQESRKSQTQFPSVSTSNESFPQVQPTSDDITPNDISKVKTLFRDIWESLRSFCCSVSDVINSPSPCSNTTIPELRLKLVQILNEVGELIASIEKIFELNLADINEHHPLIIHFAHFLNNLYPGISLDLQNKFPKCLSVFFTDFEGRSLLSRSLADFREFSQGLIKSSEYFEAHFA